MQNYRNKLFITTFIVVNVFIILLARLIYLQVINGEEYERFSVENRVRLLNISAPRGEIFDRNGDILVTNRASFDVNLFPNEVKNVDLLSSRLSSILKKDKADIEKKIREARKLNLYSPVKIAVDIDRDTLALLEARRAELEGISIDVNYLRDYKNGKLASLLIGYLGKPDENDLSTFKDIKPSHHVGKTGIERKLQEYLKGEDGTNYKVIDALGREVKLNLFKQDIRDQEVVEGDNIYLTIDRSLQAKAEEELADKAGAVVVMNVHTGEILAMASSPSYDPASFVKGIDRKAWNRITSDERFPLLNRATQSTYPPGSVYKIVPALAALNEGIIDPETTVYCPGHYKIGRKRFRCWKWGGHGHVNLVEAITQSCDVYFYHIGEKLGIEKLSRYSRIFGFGTDTNFSLSERSGIVPTKEWKMREFNTQWYRGETVVTSIGQGYLTATPLQVSVMISSIANGGAILKPLLIKKIISNEGNLIDEFTPEIKRKLPFSDKDLDIIRESLVQAVNNKRGTGRNAIIDEYTVAGKTGTSQVVAMNLQTDIYKHSDHAWFSAYFPAENPEISVTVLVEHGGKGGSVAAPIAKSVIKEYIKIDSNSVRTAINGED